MAQPLTICNAMCFIQPIPIVAQNGNIVVSFIVRTAYLETHVTLHLKQNSTLALSREKVENFFTFNKRAVMIVLSWLVSLPFTEGEVIMFCIMGDRKSVV